MSIGFMKSIQRTFVCLGYVSLLIAFIAAPVSAEVQQQWEYEIVLSPEQGDDGSVSATMVAFFDQRNASSIEGYWHLEQSAIHQLPFPARIGFWHYSTQTGIVDEAPAAMGIVLDERKYIVDVPVPLVSLPAQVEPGDEWQVGAARISFVGETQRNDSPCVEIQVADEFDRVTKIWVEAEGERVIALEKRVFIGQGIGYTMKIERTAIEEIDEGDIPVIVDEMTQLLEARDQMGYGSQVGEWSLDDEGRSVLSAVVEGMSTERNASVLSLSVFDARATLNEEERRARSLDQLRDRAIGETIPAFDVVGLDGEGLARADLGQGELEGKTIIFHFWKYRDESLEQPYGQIGFLDFLARRSNESVAVYGVTIVAADDRDAQRAQIQSSRRLREFMNLSYPILIDQGDWIASVGDPREARLSLPLWIVVDKTGRIRAYHAGLLEEDPRAAIDQLESWIQAAEEASR